MDERWRIRTNKEIQDILYWKDSVKFTKSLQLRWYGHVEIMPKQIATATMGEKEKKVEEGKKEDHLKGGRTRSKRI